MHITILSNLCSLNVYNELIPKKYRMGQHYQKYFRLIAEGLVQNGCDVSAVSVYPVNKRINNKIFLKKKREIIDGINYIYLCLVNIPIIKNVSIVLNVFKYVSKMKRDEIVILDLLNFSISIGTFLGSKISKVKIVGVLTDMPTIYVGNENSKPTIQGHIP